MFVAEFRHERFPELGTALLEQLGADPEAVAGGSVAQPPAAEPGEYGDELDGRFGEVVTGALPGARGVACEHSGVGQSFEAVGEDVGGDALFGAGQEFAVVAPVDKDDVAQHDEAPAITEDLDGGVDGAS